MCLMRASVYNFHCYVCKCVGLILIIENFLLCGVAFHLTEMLNHSHRIE